MKRYALAFYFALISAAYGQQKAQTPEQQFNYYWANKDKIENGDAAVIEQAIAALTGLQKKACLGGCRDFRIYFLLGRFNCALHNTQSLDYFNTCLTYTRQLTASDIGFLHSCIASCQQDQASPAINVQIGMPKAGERGGIRASVNGSLNMSVSGADEFLGSKTELYQANSCNLFDNGLYFPAYRRSEKDSATRRYGTFFKSHGEQGWLEPSSSRSFLLYAAKGGPTVRLQQLETTLAHYLKNFGLKRPTQLIVIFLIPARTATRAQYKLYSEEHPDRKPDDLFDLDFRDFAFLKDDYRRTPGEYAYNNPYNYSIVCYKNSTGYLDEELMHLAINASYPACPDWLNAGMATLFERTSKALVPLNNSRLGVIYHIPKEKYPLYLKQTLTENPDGLDDTTYSERMAFSRYFCFYLYSRHLLSPFMKKLLGNLSPDIGNARPDLVQQLSALGHFADLDAMASDFSTFVQEQIKLCYSPGSRLKPAYQGTLNNDQLH